MRLMRLKLPNRKPKRPAKRPAYLPTFVGINLYGCGYVHEMCAFCFGGGEAAGCTGAPCFGAGYLKTPIADEYETRAIVAEHKRRGTNPFHGSSHLDTLGHTAQ